MAHGFRWEYLYLISVVAVVVGEEPVVNATNFDEDGLNDELISMSADEDNDDALSTTRAVSSAVLPKPFALLSIICSYTMIREIIADQRALSRDGSPIKRMLLSIALADIVFSFGIFLGTWPAPPDTYYSNTIGNSGSQGFCDFQGFCIMLGGIASILANVALSVFYLFVVRYGKADRDLERFEWGFQATIWVVGMFWAIYPIPMDLYNLQSTACFLVSIPPDCSGDDCIRGSDTTIHDSFLAGMIICAVCIIAGIMTSIFLKVRKVENRNKKYATCGHYSQTTKCHNSNNDEIPGNGNGMPAQRNSSVNRQKSLAVARQGIFYALAFLTIYLFFIISTIRYSIDGTSNATFEAFAYGVFAPSAGTLNFLVFARRREKMKTPEGRLLRALLCCSCWRRKRNDSTGAGSGHGKGSTQQQQQQQQPHEGCHNVSTTEEEFKTEE